MKKLLAFFVFFSLISSAYCQTLFTYGNHSVSVNEFSKAFNKNKTATPDKAQSLRDYLDLYIKFKLKVQAAKDLHLDTLPSLQADLPNFRSQIEENYLKDDKEVNALINEAFSRSQKDMHVLDFFVPLNNLDSTDSIKAYNEINQFYQQLKNGKKDISAIIADVNKHGGSIRQNDLGFITVFTLPYEFENIIYGLKPGQSSAPYRSPKGWHIFKNVEERHAMGKIKLAQILFAVPENPNPQRSQTKKLADSIYSILKDGADFSKLAKEFSDDKMTYMNGGNMPEFGVSKYGGEFEREAFSLKKDGEISQPFETEFGYHIIKRISATPVPATKNDDTFMYDLKQEVMNDSRIAIARRKFVSEILPEIGFKKNAINEENLWRVTDSSLLANKEITAGKVDEKTILFSYNNHEQTKVSEWIQFSRNSNKPQTIPLRKTYKIAFPDFIAASAINNYRMRLQNFNINFKNQLDEFKEGSLLFEIMQRKVWNKASADSAGLLQYYNQHKEKYLWSASAEAVIFSCSNESVAGSAIAQLKKGKSWKEVMNDNSSRVHADSGRYELSQIPVIDKTNFTEGLITLPIVNKNDGTAAFTKIIKLYPGHQQRNFEEARGLVVNDYQNYLEEKWVEQLRKQYPIKVNEKVFQSLLK
ncbi:MAG: peptidylprolyl isomerase [Bacteroidota bacterium]|nr:peptidylprolyl isomerase [Bacteroidota bacterium]